jgi:hypothetical protein
MSTSHDAASKSFPAPCRNCRRRICPRPADPASAFAGRDRRGTRFAGKHHRGEHQPEGANLVARGGTQLETGSQDIIYALMASAPPLNVNSQGMVYITRVMGVKANGVSRSVVLDQYRWDDAVRNLGFRANSYAPGSNVYSCTTWSAANCTSINAASRPTTPIMSGKLDDGEIVVVVETYYRYDMLISAFSIGSYSLPTIGPNLYSLTVF